MHKIFLFLVISFLCSSCQQYHSSWRAVYKSDKSGATILGDKQRVINAVRQGASIRIGWGWKGENHSIEHLSEPIWLAILDEKEVMAHLDAQVLSSIDWANLTASYADSSLLKQEWRVVLTTSGDFDAVWYDRENHRVTRRIPQNHTMTWFVKDVESSKYTPLFATDEN